MKNVTLSCFLLFSCFYFIQAQDTFSIVAVDPETGEIGSAGATCVTGIGNFGGVILLSGIIPGRGGVNAQAYICINPHVNLDNAIARLGEGLTPDEVINWLLENDECPSQDFDPEYRQYGIVALDEDGAPSAAAFTGTQADDWKGHRVGNNYSIQGNILIGPEVVDSMEARFLAAEGDLAARLMAAMQGANIPGADERCLSAGTSSTSAFLRVFKPDDPVDAPSLELNVAEAPAGVEPIDSLQVLYDQWLLTSTTSIADQLDLKLIPNPAQGQFAIFGIQDLLDLSVQVFNLNGQLVLREQLASDGQRIQLKEEGTYLIQVITSSGQIVYSGKLVNF
jgi:uncharacterized Ntn-hydrolase superfamily protein